MENLYQKFGKYYDQIYDSFYDYKQECDNLEELFGKFSKTQPKSILDISCGTGTHAIELSKRGYKLTGIDISPVMIEEAKKKAHDAQLDIDFRIQDMKDMDLGVKFDAAMCIFGGFGYLVTKDDLGRFLSRVRDTLKKTSLFVFEFWNIEAVKPGLKSWIRTRNEGEGTTLIRLNESEFDKETNIITVTLDFYLFRGSEVLDPFTEVHKLRCFSVPEIKEILEDGGFDLTATFGKDVKTQTLESPLENAFNVIAVATMI